MNPYGIETSESAIQGPVVSLNILYNEMPATRGCERCDEVNGDDAIWCCLAPDTLVYTVQGPIPISDLAVGDSVFTKSGLRQVKRVGKREVSEILVLKLSNGRRIRLTPDHRVYASSITRWDKEDLSVPVFIEAENLVPKKSNKFGHYVILPKAPKLTKTSSRITVTSFVHGLYEENGYCFTSKNKQGNSIQNKWEITPQDAFVFGLFIAEGSCQYGVVNFHLHKDELQLVKRIEKFAHARGLQVNQKTDHGKAITVRFCSVILSQLFERLFGQGCENKHIDKNLFSIFVHNANLRKALVNGYYAGDGVQKMRQNRRSSTTTSQRWSEQLAMLYWLSGNVYSISGHERPNRKKSYTIYKTCTEHTKCSVNEHGHLLSVKSVSKEPFDGYVHDIEILGEESFVTHAGEVHNCRTHNPSMYYVEFLNVWQQVQKWSKEKRADLIIRSIKNHLLGEIDKGCVFWSDECLVYDHRPFACFMAGTMVLTEYGPIPIENVYAGTKVLTHAGRYKRVIQTASRLSDESSLCEVSCKGDLGVYCTKDHKFWTARSIDKRKSFSGLADWVNADNIIEKKSGQIGDYLSFPKFSFGPGIHEIDISFYVDCSAKDDGLYPLNLNCPPGKIITPCPSKITVDSEFLWMLGMYLAEGSFSGSCIRFTLHRDEQNSFGKRLVRYFERIGLSVSEGCVKPNIYTTFVHSKVFGDFLTKMCGKGAKNKSLFPPLLKDMSSQQLFEVYRGWNDGDGQKHPGNGIHFRTVTISRLLAYQMYFILKSNDMHPFLYEENRDNRSNKSYSVVLYSAGLVDLKPGQGNCYKIEDNYTYYPARKKNVQFPSQVTVFDLQVEDDESFVTSCGIVHNCRMYAVIPQESWDSRVANLKERYGEDYKPRPQCDLVSVEGDSITKYQEDKWFRHTANCEKRIGINPNVISAHDEPQGSYRTFHDHVLLELFDEGFLTKLSMVRLSNPSPEDIDEFVEALETELRKNDII